MKEEILENIKKPYFKNMEKLGLIESKKELVLNKIFNQPVRIKGNDIYDINDNIIVVIDSGVKENMIPRVEKSILKTVIITGEKKNMIPRVMKSIMRIVIVSG